MFPARNGPHRQRTHDLPPLGLSPALASVPCRETRLEFRRARPSFLGRHGDGANALPFHSQIFEELAHLAGTSSQTSQFKDPFARLGHGASGVILDGFADQLAIGNQLADRAIDVPSPESV